MSDVELVIKMSEEEYKKIIEYGECDYLRVINAIENGELLPEGHGRIGDLDAVMSDIFTSINEMTNIGVAVDGEYLWAKLNDAIDNAQTLIKADKQESAGNANEEEIIKGLESVKEECGRHLNEGFAWICEPIDRAIKVLEEMKATRIKPLMEADAPKRRKGIPLEENDSGYNCENWIP